MSKTPKLWKSSTQVNTTDHAFGGEIAGLQDGGYVVVWENAGFHSPAALHHADRRRKPRRFWGNYPENPQPTPVTTAEAASDGCCGWIKCAATAASDVPSRAEGMNVRLAAVSIETA